MALRLLICVFLMALTCSASAQTRVRTESIKPPATTQSAPEIISDLSRLPAPVAAMRERILNAARSGELAKLVAVMKSSATPPIFTNGDERDPVKFWKDNYPDSDGAEILSILVAILETPFVHVEKGTPQEMYLWPYFASVPLNTLTPEQKVELFRIVTGADYKEMVQAGGYSFYRAGIGPDGTWHFFASGD